MHGYQVTLTLPFTVEIYGHVHCQNVKFTPLCFVCGDRGKAETGQEHLQPIYTPMGGQQQRNHVGMLAYLPLTEEMVSAHEPG